MEKTCKKCLKTLSLEDFYSHREMADGHLSFCKECVKNRVSARSKTPEGRRLGRDWFKTVKGKLKLARHTKRHRVENPEKYHHDRVHQNLKDS